MSLSAFKKCLRKKQAQGQSFDAAGDLCRHVDPAYNPAPLPLKAAESKTVQEVGPASSVGPGWRSQGANIGTGAVVYPDPKEAADAFLKATPAPSKDRKAWEMYADRLGVSPQGVDLGWNYIQSHHEENLARATLKKVFGESTAWAGSWVPLKNLIDPNKREVQPKDKPFKDKQPKVQPEEPIPEAIAVMGIKTHQAPQVGNARGQAIQAQDPGFPFGTWSAKKVWEMAQQLVSMYPLKNPAEILAMAIQKSGVLTSELTPEDDQLLKMAIDFLQNGPARTNVRTGGAPGGPGRQGDGVSVYP
jgi:hypothetical protein